MTYTLITDQYVASQAFEVFRDGFARGAKVFLGHTVGFQGGHNNCDVYWHRDLGIWGLFEPRAVKGRFWICFGTENPAKHTGLNITVEINPPTSGVNLYCAGAFVKDETRRIYISHSGKIGGGRKGVGKAAFREFAADRKWEPIRVSGGRRLEVTILAQLESEELGENILSFVEEVAEFKRLHAGGTRTQQVKGADVISSAKARNKTGPRSGKYLPLYEYFKDLVSSEWPATFGEIERILGFSLPKSAYSYPAWWSNGSGMPHSSMWLDAGWRTSDLNLTRKSVHFSRDRAAKTRRNAIGQRSDSPDARTAKRSITPVKKGKSHELGLRYNWIESGELTLDAQSKLVFPKLSVHPGIYRFRLAKDGQKSVYIGESDNLPRRFQHYRTPGPSQATNIRLNKIFVDALGSSHRISVDVIVNTAWISSDRGEEQADLTVKATRMLFEHAAIIQSRAADVHILNR